LTEEKLKALRDEIDRIDEQLLLLLSQRLRVADEIAKLKKKLGMGIRDEAREQIVIERAKKRAQELGLDPSFVESIMRLAISHAVAVEARRVAVPGIWAEVAKAFERHPAQLKVVRLLFKYGLKVREDGEIACGSIRIPSVQIAREAGVDRRVVDATARRILGDEKLISIFGNLEPLAYLKGVAHRLGLGVIEILPKDAAKPGIISEVTGVISRFGISIRQAVADDPFFTPQPKLTIITDEPVPGKVIDELRKLPTVRSVIVY